MSRKLPYNGFKWMKQTELLELKASPKEFFERLRKEGKMCAVMGDFTVPIAIHNKMTWDYPLMPEKASIPEDQLSPKQVELNELEQQNQAQLTPTVPPSDHLG